MILDSKVPGGLQECGGGCPKEIPIANIARMNREFVKATLLRGR